MNLIKSITSGFRSLAASLSLQPKDRPRGFVKYSGDVRMTSLPLIVTLAKLSSLEIANDQMGKVAAGVVSDKCQVFIDIEGMDLSAESAKIEKKLASAKKMLEGYVAKRSVAGYDKVPSSVRAMNQQKEESLTAEIEELTKALATFSLI